MDDDERPRRRSTEGNFGAASHLASESLESYSLEELDARVVLLESEITRSKRHREKSAAHLLAAQTLFRSKPA